MATRFCQMLQDAIKDEKKGTTHYAVELPEALKETLDKSASLFTKSSAADAEDIRTLSVLSTDEDMHREKLEDMFHRRCSLG